MGKKILVGVVVVFLIGAVLAAFQYGKYQSAMKRHEDAAQRNADADIKCTAENDKRLMNEKGASAGSSVFNAGQQVSSSPVVCPSPEPVPAEPKLFDLKSY